MCPDRKTGWFKTHLKYSATEIKRIKSIVVKAWKSKYTPDQPESSQVQKKDKSCKGKLVNFNFQLYYYIWLTLSRRIPSGRLTLRRSKRNMDMITLKPTSMSPYLPKNLSLQLVVISITGPLLSRHVLQLLGWHLTTFLHLVSIYLYIYNFI